MRKIPAQIFIVYIASLLMVTCCTGNHSEYIVGTWMSEETETEWGPMILTYQFNNDLSVVATAAVPVEGKANKSVFEPIVGNYQQNGQSIIVHIGKADDYVKGKIVNESLTMYLDDNAHPIYFKKISAK